MKKLLPFVLIPVLIYSCTETTQIEGSQVDYMVLMNDTTQVPRPPATLTIEGKWIYHIQLEKGDSCPPKSKNQDTGVIIPGNQIKQAVLKKGAKEINGKPLEALKIQGNRIKFAKIKANLP